MNKKILLVDDEVNVLNGFQRQLRRGYEIETAVGGVQAIDTFRTKGPFAVVVSDMQMPDLSGIELLRQLREIDKSTIRIMLTGNADQTTAVSAVNEGEIFRFLNKPCPAEDLAKVLDRALEQYRLITAEAELLTHTLSGSIRVLTEILSMVMPEAFGTACVARRMAREVSKKIGAEPAWQIELAAMLARIGCVSLPQDIVRDYLSGKELAPDKLKLLNTFPQRGHDLLANIPRLEGVAKLILAQLQPFSTSVPVGARILKAVGDYQRFSIDLGYFQSIKSLETQPQVYDPQVIQALHEIVSGEMVSLEVQVTELKVGMVLDEHVTTRGGDVLVSSGHEVHEAMISKLTNYLHSTRGIRQPIRVKIPAVLYTPALRHTNTNPLSQFV